jgi:hypothetical protein
MPTKLPDEHVYYEHNRLENLNWHHTTVGAVIARKNGVVNIKNIEIVENMCYSNNK